ncbi:hypothetical protein [Paraburkholderia dinghuensis]|uniref:DUF707 domain-containing protein n=1 Tax=Paraburkholderia dinghuensis TaxID=2305225 RepID=A0A3N6N5F4_9BURK|nr:hypothetical protein [Paraburkholderia dinghuensis]RQH04142.1 hypothetical protein D1Y85_18790 [Paraburkholderia dinghuensis]
MKSDNLIIVRAGKDSLHTKWLENTDGEPVDFDVLVAAHHKDAMKNDSGHVKYIFIPGTKVHGWDIVLSEHHDFISTYQRIALIDDDIDSDAGTLNRCFAFGRDHGLSIWQPSLTHDSYATYGACLQNERFLLRHVNHVEMMCPFFEASVLREISPLFSLGFESGIDLVWCSIARDLGGRCAIIDACTVTHTKPVGGQKQLNGFIGKNYEDDIFEILRLFDMKWPSWVAETAIDRADNTIHTGISLRLSPTRLLLTFHLAPKGTRLLRLKALLDHIRHQLFRQPYYGKSTLEKISRVGKRPPKAISTLTHTAHTI